MVPLGFVMILLGFVLYKVLRIREVFSIRDGIRFRTRLVYLLLIVIFGAGLYILVGGQYSFNPYAAACAAVAGVAHALYFNARLRDRLDGRTMKRDFAELDRLQKRSTVYALLFVPLIIADQAYPTLLGYGFVPVMTFAVAGSVVHIAYLTLLERRAGGPIVEMWYDSARSAQNAVRSQ